MSSTTDKIRVEAIYNPQNQSKTELIEGFVVRQNTFQRLFKAIKEAKMEVPEQHYLILGRRGMGKTTLLLRLAYEIENDPALNSWLIPIVFNEEEYGIRRLFNLWERVMALMEQQHPDFRFEESEIQQISGQYNDDDAYERALFERLESELQRSGKKLILFMDNFGDMARKLSNEEAHRLRKILQTSPNLRIIAASSVVLEAFYRYDHPFYEFFKTIELRGLDKEEIRELLLSLSQHYQKEAVARIVEEHPGRVEALRRITGGVIRTVVLLFEIFADDDDGSAFKDLEIVLDRVTPLYKHRMDDLSDQQQAIVQTIALNWDALSVKEIAEKTRLESKIISAQLQSLEKNGIIRKTPTKTKNHLYIVEERFFNVWYLMRNGRRNDEKRVRWLVRFFEEWCDDAMMKTRAEGHRLALAKGGFDPEAAFTYTQAMAQTQKLSLADRHELLRDTRSYLAAISPELASELKHSDFDQLFEVVKIWHQEPKNIAIKKLAPILKSIIDTMGNEIAFDVGDEKKLLEFLETSIPTLSAQLGVEFATLSSPEYEKSEQCWLWAALDGIPGAMNNLAKLSKKIKDDLPAAIDWYQKAAESGDTEAMFNLGLLYMEDEKDIEKAAFWYQKAADAGDRDSMNNLAVIFINQNSIEKAKYWFEKSANLEDVDAMNNLAHLYNNKLGDIDQSIFWHTKASDLGHVEAMFDLGRIYQFKKPDLAKAIEWYTKAAEQGHNEAMNNLGVIQINMNKIPKAIEWFEKAATLGNLTSIVNLGKLYLFEKEDVGNATRWFEKAVKFKDAVAMYYLGLIAEIEEKNTEKALAWYTSSAQDGDANAMYRIGEIYLNNKENSAEALAWFEKSADAGNVDALRRIGQIFQIENKDIQNAITWFTKAVESGDVESMLYLGMLYQFELNSINQATEWYEKAANAGNTDAMVNLGVLLQEKSDVDKAMEWYKKAADMENAGAMNNIAWHLFKNKLQKAHALEWIKKCLQLDNGEGNLGFQHTAACIFAWNAKTKESKKIAVKFLFDNQYLEKYPEDIIIYLTLMLAKDQAPWLLELFTSPEGEALQLKDRFKPIYYATLKTLDHPDFLRMGEELEQTVDEILARAKQMAVDYA